MRSAHLLDCVLLLFSCVGASVQFFTDFHIPEGVEVSRSIKGEIVYLRSKRGKAFAKVSIDSKGRLSSTGSEDLALASCVHLDENGVVEWDSIEYLYSTPKFFRQCSSIMVILPKRSPSPLTAIDWLVRKRLIEPHTSFKAWLDKTAHSNIFYVIVFKANFAEIRSDDLNNMQMRHPISKL